MVNLDNLKDQIQNISLYDVKAYVRKAQNAVLNYTEMEAKVREATNNEPWGASSSLMQDIAEGTYHYQQFNEIMTLIYRRFTEKSAEEWRQIYKALQLLEFLVKNGAERVVDDARSHLNTISMLRSFHYIDMNGKDQGINIRNRAKELVTLLENIELIRTERKKARANKLKYKGIQGGASSFSGFGSSGGGFGSSSNGSSYRSSTYGDGDEIYSTATGDAYSSHQRRMSSYANRSSRMGGSSGYGGYSGGVYGDGGGFNGSDPSIINAVGRYDPPRVGGKNDFEEYDEGTTVGSSKTETKSSTINDSNTKALPAKPQEKTIDLFSFEEPISSTGTSNNNNNNSKTLNNNDDNDDDDDDFDDFQSAAEPVSNNVATSSIVDLFNTIPAASTSSNLTSTIPTGPNYSVTGFQTVPNTNSVSLGATNNISTTSIGTKKEQSKGNDAFSDLWSTASKGIKTSEKKSSGTESVALADLAAAKAQNGMWGVSTSNTSTTNTTNNTTSSAGNGLDDLLL